MDLINKHGDDFWLVMSESFHQPKLGNSMDLRNQKWLPLRSSLAHKGAPGMQTPQFIYIYTYIVDTIDKYQKMGTRDKMGVAQLQAQ
jgi:hypothetical protein